MNFQTSEFAGGSLKDVSNLPPADFQSTILAKLAKLAAMRQKKENPPTLLPSGVGKSSPKIVPSQADFKSEG
jgi:hypothetical protein